MKMKTETYNIVIDKISEVHGRYPGSVDVSFHREGGSLTGRDGFETKRVALSDAIIKADGSVDQDKVQSEVLAAVGTTETVEVWE